MSISPQESLQVPRQLTDLMSPEWLNSALGYRFPDIRISKVTPGPVISRVSTNARFQIECVDQPGDLSPHLCVKGYFTDEGWLGRRTGIYEVSFYRDLAARTGVRTLRSVYAGVDPETGHGIVITEDVLAAGGRFLDATSAYTPDQAAESLSQLAQLHSSTWNDPTLADVDWLAPRLRNHVGVRGVKEIRHNFECEIGAGVPDEVRDPDRLVAAYLALVELARESPTWTVVHGDAHVGNLFLDGRNRPSFLDWQLVQRAPWWLDVGYHISSALTVEDRRRTERDLVRHYLDQLRAGGVEPPSWDDAWLGFRRGIVHGFYLWGITMKVNPAITTVLQTRLGTAAADHQSFEAVGA